jgi:hypothetical protein
MRLTDSSEELTRQRIQIWLALFKGEWFANILAGIPYLKNDNNTTQILGAVNKKIFDSVIREGIQTRKGVVTLLSYYSVLDTSSRTITVSFKASTVTGEIVNVEALPITL